jgi:hypothetical protein
MFFKQESLIFFPNKLEAGYTFRFANPFHELTIKVGDNVNLNGLLFEADSSKGLVFYLHGNAGALDSWGWAYQNYVAFNYDFFILDYRGYGKSDGAIDSEEQFLTDIQIVYDHLKKDYDETKIIIAGYSLGTCAAAKLASENNPALLILQAPYYSFIDLKDEHYPILPDFIVRYKFETYKYLEKTKTTVYIFHGDADEVIPYKSSLKLQKHLKPGDQLITLPGQSHNGINENPVFHKELQKILQNKGD